jgi:hypothetical protein
MTYRIQKTIISKYLVLVDKATVSESDVSELLYSTEKLYKDGVLIASDIYRQKIALIVTNLSTNLETIKRKRVNKEIKLEYNQDLISILKADIDNVEYAKTDLADIQNFENEKQLEISFLNVKSVIENVVIGKRRLSSEKDLEKFVADQLRFVFNKERVHQQYSVGGPLALKTDIDIGNGQVGIELKLADNLGAVDMQRVIGQLVYYKNRFYNDRLILLIVSKTTINSTMQELKEFIEELGITVVYVKAINL